MVLRVKEVKLVVGEYGGGRWCEKVRYIGSNSEVVQLNL